MTKYELFKNYLFVLKCFDIRTCHESLMFRAAGKYGWQHCNQVFKVESTLVCLYSWWKHSILLLGNCRFYLKMRIKYWDKSFLFSVRKTRPITMPVQWSCRKSKESSIQKAMVPGRKEMLINITWPSYTYLYPSRIRLFMLCLHLHWTINISTGLSTSWFYLFTFHLQSGVVWTMHS